MSRRILRKWKARRSGATISIEGVDAETGRWVTITRVPLLAPENGRLVARDTDGQAWELALEDNPLPARVAWR